jgi:hypothetical protein
MCDSLSPDRTVSQAIGSHIKEQLKRGMPPRLEFKGASGVLSYHAASSAAAATASSAEQEEGRLGDVLRKVHEVTGVHLATSQRLGELMLDSLGTGRLVHQLRGVLPLKTSELFGDASVEVRDTRAALPTRAVCALKPPADTVESPAPVRSWSPLSTRAVRRRLARSSPSP